jgi:hypothetical protein
LFFLCSGLGEIEEDDEEQARINETFHVSRVSADVGIKCKRDVPETHKRTRRLSGSLHDTLISACKRSFLSYVENKHDKKERKPAAV